MMKNLLRSATIGKLDSYNLNDAKHNANAPFIGPERDMLCWYARSAG